MINPISTIARKIFELTFVDVCKNVRNKFEFSHIVLSVLKPHIQIGKIQKRCIYHVGHRIRKKNSESKQVNGICLTFD
jgi:hypothetical protein